MVATSSPAARCAPAAAESVRMRPAMGERTSMLCGPSWSFGDEAALMDGGADGARVGDRARA